MCERGRLLAGIRRLTRSLLRLDRNRDNMKQYVLDVDLQIQKEKHSAESQQNRCHHCLGDLVEYRRLETPSGKLAPAQELDLERHAGAQTLETCSRAAVRTRPDYWKEGNSWKQEREAQSLRSSMPLISRAGEEKHVSRGFLL